jgi:hypothetical protein
MDAQNKSKARRWSLQDLPAIRDVFALHFQASRRRDEILEEAEGLQVTGKTREARKLLKQAKGIQKHLKALENNCRIPGPRLPE